jgi:hypothetical protein
MEERDGIHHVAGVDRNVAASSLRPRLERPHQRGKKRPRFYANTRTVAASDLRTGASLQHFSAPPYLPGFVGCRLSADLPKPRSTLSRIEQPWPLITGYAVAIMWIVIECVAITVGLVLLVEYNRRRV